MGADGNAVIVEATEGHPLLLHFWATWCPSCVEDLAALADALAACQEPRPRVYAVDVGDSAADVEAFVTEHEIRLPLLLDPHGKTWRSLDGGGLPMNFSWRWPDERTTELGPKDAAAWRSRLAALGCETGGADAPQPEAGSGQGR